MTDTTPATKRRTGTIDLTKRLVQITDPAGATEEYRLNDLSAPTQTTLALIGLRHTLNGGDGTTWSKLMLGDVPMRKPAAEKPEKPARPLHPMKLAAAHFYADRAAKAAGLRASPGKKLHDMPAYAEHLEHFKGEVADWDAKQMKAAANIPGIVEHHNRLTGTDVDPDALLVKAAVPETAADGVVQLSEAAD